MRQEEGLYGEELFGYPSYKIADTVNKHTAFGIGIYYINTTGVYIFSHTALECPSVGEIYLKHVSARYFGGYGQINHTINSIKGYEDEAKNLAIELFISDPVEEN
jgi:hypothetical protein